MTQLRLVQLPSRGSHIQKGSQWVPKKQKDHRNGFTVKIEPGFGQDWKYTIKSSDKLGVERSSGTGFASTIEAQRAAESDIVMQSNRVDGVLFDMKQKPEHHFG